ncbi:MAG: DUF4386 family protein [Anaerolineales bacterium]
MKDDSLNKLGGLCSILLGASYVLVGALFLLLPADQRALSSATAEAFYRSYDQNPTLLMVYYWMFAAGAVFALGALPAITESVRSVREGWARWTSNLAYLGFAVIAIDFFRLIALQPARAEAYLAGDASARAVFATPTLFAGLDPNGWLGFGAVGLWALVSSLVALRSDLWPRLLGYVGIAVGALYWLVVVSFVSDNAGLLQIVAALGGVVAAPIWYIWMGMRLRKPAPSM